MKQRKLNIQDIDFGTRYRTELGDLTTLKASIEEKGLIQPITVADNPDDANRYILIAGGRRLTSCLELGHDTIICMVRKLEDELDLRELELIENTHRKEMTWQEQFPLIEAMHKLQIEKYGTGASQKRTAGLLGFDSSYISKVLETNRCVKDIPSLTSESDHSNVRKQYDKKLKKALTKKMVRENKERLKCRPDNSPNTPRKTRHEEREFHRDTILMRMEESYIVGDALSKMASMQESQFCFAEVDPPYGVDFKTLRENKGADTPGLSEYNEVPLEEYPTFLENAAYQTYRLLKEGSICIWWHGSVHHQIVYDTLTKVGFNVDKVPAIWYKEGSPGNVLNPEYTLARQYEPFFVCKKGAASLRTYPTGNVFPFAGVAPQLRIHPTERPVNLIAHLIRVFAQPEPDAQILCPFLGSGNTIRASIQEGFTCTGFDLSEDLKMGFLTKVREHLVTGIYDDV